MTINRIGPRYGFVLKIESSKVIANKVKTVLIQLGHTLAMMDVLLVIVNIKELVSMLMSAKKELTIVAKLKNVSIDMV